MTPFDGIKKAVDAYHESSERRLESTFNDGVVIGALIALAVVCLVMAAMEVLR